MDNLNVLVEAKKELLSQLTNTIIPNAFECMENLYAEAKKESKGTGTLKNFQEKLADIPKWNNYQIDNEVTKCVDTCGGCLDEMVAAVFVATVKIISSVRLSKDSRKVKLKIPTNDVFILGVYTNIAKRIYENPYVFQNMNRTERRKELLERMEGVVEETVKGMLPLNQILKTYLNKNAADLMNPQTEADVGGSGSDDDEEGAFPGTAEHPIEGDEGAGDEDEDGVGEGEGVGDEGPSKVAGDEGLGEGEGEDEETKSITFNDRIIKNPAPTPERPGHPIPTAQDDEGDFINPGARR